MFHAKVLMPHLMGIKTILCDSNFCSFQNNIAVSDFSELSEKVTCDAVIYNKLVFGLRPFSDTRL